MFLCRNLLHDHRLSFKQRSLVSLKNTHFFQTSPSIHRLSSSLQRLDFIPGSKPNTRPKHANAKIWALDNVEPIPPPPKREEGREEDPEVSQATLVRLLKEAVKANDKLALRLATRDLLSLPDHPERDEALRGLLLRTAHQTLIRWNTVQSIINGLSWDGILDKYSDYDLRALTKTCRISADQAKTDGLSFTADDFNVLLHSTIITRLNSRRRVPIGAKSVVHEPPIIVDAAFELLYSLLVMKKEKLVLDLFQALTEKLYIPPEAVQQAPASSTDFYYIISVTLVRACLYWHKRHLAHRLLLNYLPSSKDLDSAIRQKDPLHFPHSTTRPAQSQQPVSQEESRQSQSLDPQFLDLVSETLYATLRNPNLFELQLCVDVICRVHLLAPVQSAIIRLMYTVATESGFGDVARRLYAFTREPAIEAEHRYPGPQGKALLFFMTFLTEQKSSTHLARTLANEVVENDTFLPVHDRANFVAIVASQGFARAARTLWERYSVGKDRFLVVGYNTVLTRMVRLFTRMARTIEANLSDHDRIEISSSGLEKTEFSDSSDIAALEERAQDITNFVQRVIAAFVEAHQPLKNARHFDLSSLARAHFVTGNFAKGFGVFRFLIRRREVPDLVDINIGLSALAEHRPRSAAKLIEVMIGKGIQPDSVTFGTIIHHALLHNDLQLVGNLLQRARQAGDVKLSPQGLSSLTRASVSLNGSGASHLRDALKLLRAMPKSGILSSPDMGKYMVFVALQAREPKLGFEFWKLLVQKTMEWDDLEHVHMRRLLGRLILKTLKPGRVENSVMLKELQERPSYRAVE